MGHFLPFYPPNIPKNQNLQKIKKTPGDIIILHKCTKSHDNVLSWDMACDILKFYFLFWALFCPFTPLTAQKMKKIPGIINILHICTTNYDQMMYGSWDMVPDEQAGRRTNGRMEKVTYRGGCLNQKCTLPHVLILNVTSQIW